MRRDWSIVRQILEKVEDETLSEHIDALHQACKTGWSGEECETAKQLESEFAQHLELLIDSGMLKGVQLASTTKGQVRYLRIEPKLTMAGYDLLEVLRTKTHWSKVLDALRSAGVAITMEGIQCAARKVIRDALS